MVTYPISVLCHSVFEAKSVLHATIESFGAFQGGYGGGSEGSLELVQRFGFEPDLSNDVIQERLKELQEQIKKKILTEMKIKEGAENLRKVTSDKKKSHVNSIVKDANSKLEQLNEELQEVNAYLLMTNNHDAPGESLTPDLPSPLTLLPGTHRLSSK